jgi:hypothetical protein
MPRRGALWARQRRPKGRSRGCRGLAIGFRRGGDIEDERVATQHSAHTQRTRRRDGASLTWLVHGRGMSGPSQRGGGVRRDGMTTRCTPQVQRCPARSATATFATPPISRPGFPRWRSPREARAWSSDGSAMGDASALRSQCSPVFGIVTSESSGLGEELPGSAFPSMAPGASGPAPAQPVEAMRGVAHLLRSSLWDHGSPCRVPWCAALTPPHERFTAHFRPAIAFDTG